MGHRIAKYEDKIIFINANIELFKKAAWEQTRFRKPHMTDNGREISAKAVSENLYSTTTTPGDIYHSLIRLCNKEGIVKFQ